MSSSSFAKRQERVRRNLKKNAKSKRPRLSVVITNGHIYTQLINDETGEVIAAVSTVQKDVAKSLKTSKKNKEAAAIVGMFIAEKAKKAGVEAIVFDRGGRLYHGKVKSLAEAAREAGLKF